MTDFVPCLNNKKYGTMFRVILNNVTINYDVYV